MQIICWQAKGTAFRSQGNWFLSVTFEQCVSFWSYPVDRWIDQWQFSLGVTLLAELNERTRPVKWTGHKVMRHGLTCWLRWVEKIKIHLMAMDRQAHDEDGTRTVVVVLPVAVAVAMYREWHNGNNMYVVRVGWIDREMYIIWQRRRWWSKNSTPPPPTTTPAPAVPLVYYYYAGRQKFDSHLFE